MTTTASTLFGYPENATGLWYAKCPTCHRWITIIRVHVGGVPVPMTRNHRTCERIQVTHEIPTRPLPAVRRPA